MMPSTKIDQNFQLGSTTWPTELKVETFLKDISLAKGQYIISSCAKIQVSIPGPWAPLVLLSPSNKFVVDVMFTWLSVCTTYH